MKVLAFSCYYTPEIAASLYLTEDIYKGIVDAGHTLEVFVPSPTRGVDDDTRRKYKSRKIEKKYNGKIVIHRVSMFKEGKNSVLRAFRYLLINIIFILKGIGAKADIIFIQSTPPTQGMMAGIIGKIKHIPVVYNLQDIFPDSMVNAGMTEHGSVIWKVGRKVEDYSYKKSKKIIVISDDFKKNILDKGVPEEKIVVVPNWPDIDAIHPIPRHENVLITRYGLDPKKFYITYCGNVGFTQNMDLLLDVAKRLMNDLVDLVICIIGDGADRGRVKKRIEEENINNVILLPFQPYGDIAHVFSLGDVGMIISKPGVGNNAVPSKTWNIMAASKPVLASFDSGSALCKLIDQINCGIHVEAGDEEALEMAVRLLYQYNHDEMGIAGRNYLLNTLNKDKCVSTYVRTIEEGIK